MKEAAIEAKQGGERGITARSVKKVTAVSITSLGSLGPAASDAFAIGLACQVQGMSFLLEDAEITEIGMTSAPGTQQGIKPASAAPRKNPTMLQGLRLTLAIL